MPKPAPHFLYFKLLRIFECRGAGGIRTLVQTSNYNAFYMFSLHLVFDARPTENGLSYTYLLKILVALPKP